MVERDSGPYKAGLCFLLCLAEWKGWLAAWALAGSGEPPVLGFGGELGPAGNKRRLWLPLHLGALRGWRMAPLVGHTRSIYLLGAGSHVAVGSSDPCSHGASMVSACREQMRAHDCNEWERGWGKHAQVHGVKDGFSEDPTVS